MGCGIRDIEHSYRQGRHSAMASGFGAVATALGTSSHPLAPVVSSSMLAKNGFGCMTEAETLCGKCDARAAFSDGPSTDCKQAGSSLKPCLWRRKAQRLGRSASYPHRLPKQFYFSYMA